VTHLQVDETTTMFTQHAVFAEPLADDDTEDGEDQDTTEQQAQNTDSDTQDDQNPVSVAPTGTSLRYYSAEPSYLKPQENRDTYPHPAMVTPPNEQETQEHTSLLEVLHPGSSLNQPEPSIQPSRPLHEIEGSSSVTDPDLVPPTPQWGQYRQELPSISLWDASPTPTQRTNYLSRSCSICEKQMITLNSFQDTHLPCLPTMDPKEPRPCRQVSQ
jgi:hypothetical protein